MPDVTGTPLRDLVVFHAPYPLGSEDDRGSALRPQRMLEAMRAQGVDVLEITGDSRQRSRGLRQLRGMVRRGRVPVAAYAENASIPTLLTDPGHIPRRPLVDVRIFRLLKRLRVPVGYFYRDCYWAFPRYVQSVGWYTAIGMRALYRMELTAIKGLVDIVFLPSLPMADHLPRLDRSMVRALPPGGGREGGLAPKSGSRSDDPPDLQVLYVGGVGEYYRIHSLLEAAADLPWVRIILVTRRDEWEHERSSYASQITSLGDRLEVHHVSGADLEPLYSRADVCSLMMAPDAYRDFAAPVKLFEYISHGCPTIATAGSYAADLVTDMCCGMAVDYSPQAIGKVLTELYADRGRLRGLQCAAREAAVTNTWDARARTVLDTLSQVNPIVSPFLFRH